MSLKIFRTFGSWQRMGLLLAVILLAACVPPANIDSTEPPSVEPATPTPEVFNPLNPSPTPSTSALPLSCQVTDLKVYVNEAAGYCFAYPENFDLDERQAPDIVGLYSPALDQTLEPVRAGLGITVLPLPEGSDLNRLVDAYLAQASLQNLPWSIERSSLALGGQPAVQLEDVPGGARSRLLMALHQDVLFMLHFIPLHVVVAEADFAALFQTVTGSFAFYKEADRAQLNSGLHAVRWYEYGQTITLTVDPRLAPLAEAVTVSAVPLGEGLFSESHPAYVQFRLLGFQGGQPYDLPLAPVENRLAQVMVFQTADFANFDNDTPYDFPSQQQALADLLQTGITPERCDQPLAGYEQALPFLPWLNAQQVFCTQPKVIEFASGQGLRYLTHYAQGPSPILDHQVFYTFQGLTHDGRFYIAAFFPVTTGVFPTEAQANIDPNDLATLTEKITALNNLAEADFAPSLTSLDALIGSLQFEASPP